MLSGTIINIIVNISIFSVKYIYTEEVGRIQGVPGCKDFENPWNKQYNNPTIFF